MFDTPRHSCLQKERALTMPTNARQPAWATAPNLAKETLMKEAFEEIIKAVFQTLAILLLTAAAA
jgi:hypothetical protein